MQLAHGLLVVQQQNKYHVFFAATLYPPFFCPSMVCGMQDCGSCGGQWGTKRCQEGREAPKPNQN